jgi:hypothetical protein
VFEAGICGDDDEKVSTAYIRLYVRPTNCVFMLYGRFLYEVVDIPVNTKPRRKNAGPPTIT